MCPSAAIRTPPTPTPPAQRRKSLFVIEETKMRFLVCVCVCVCVCAWGGIFYMQVAESYLHVKNGIQRL